MSDMKEKEKEKEKEEKDRQIWRAREADKIYERKTGQGEKNGRELAGSGKSNKVM